MRCNFLVSGDKMRCGRKWCNRVIPGIYSPDKCRATCRGWPYWHQVGHWLTLILAAVCIRKRDYLWLKRKLGLLPKCGCHKRETWLNQVGSRLAILMGSLVAKCRQGYLGSRLRQKLLTHDNDIRGGINANGDDSTRADPKHSDLDGVTNNNFLTLLP